MGRVSEVQERGGGWGWGGEREEGCLALENRLGHRRPGETLRARLGAGIQEWKEGRRGREGVIRSQAPNLYNLLILRRVL